MKGHSRRCCSGIPQPDALYRPGGAARIALRPGVWNQGTGCVGGGFNGRFEVFECVTFAV